MPENDGIRFNIRWRNILPVHVIVLRVWTGPWANDEVRAFIQSGQLSTVLQVDERFRWPDIQN